MTKNPCQKQEKMHLGKKYERQAKAIFSNVVKMSHMLGEALKMRGTYWKLDLMLWRRLWPTTDNVTKSFDSFSMRDQWSRIFYHIFFVSSFSSMCLKKGFIISFQQMFLTRNLVIQIYHNCYPSNSVRDFNLTKFMF